ncbi:hypothetical protein K3495_g12135 [Podosphaera aphanis]|nr:hypothetical protein K3495_g12135 [Podosphaera aphanis]
MGNGSRYVLGKGVSFSKWKSSLQAKLAKRNLLGHVFHDIEEIEPAIAPQALLAMGAEYTPQQYQELVARYRSERAARKMGEIEARNIIIDRLSDSVCPQTYQKYTAEQLLESVAKTRSESATAPYSSALDCGK